LLQEPHGVTSQKTAFFKDDSRFKLVTNITHAYAHARTLHTQTTSQKLAVLQEIKVTDLHQGKLKYPQRILNGRRRGEADGGFTPRELGEEDTNPSYKGVVTSCKTS
jgi:hypothetical protein